MSLIELLTILCVLLIVCGIALPSLQAFRQHQKLVAANHTLVSALHMARNTAITQRRTAIFCPSANGNSCTEGSDWSNGWRIHSNGHTHHQGQFPPGIHVSTTNGRSQVTYRPDGTSPGTNLTVTLCSLGTKSSQVIISNSGRIRSTPTKALPC